MYVVISQGCRQLITKTVKYYQNKNTIKTKKFAVVTQVYKIATVSESHYKNYP